MEFQDLEEKEEVTKEHLIGFLWALNHKGSEQFWSSSVFKWKDLTKQELWCEIISSVFPYKTHNSLRRKTKLLKNK